MGGPGFRAGAIGSPGVGFRGGPGVYRGVGPGTRTAAVRGGYVAGTRWAGGRPGGWYGNRWNGNRWYGNRWRGWGFPVAAAAVGLGYYGGYGYNDCIAWDGYQWVNVCYSNYYAGYGGYGGYGYW